MKLNREQVLKFIPHRPPFLFIDSVEDVVVQTDKGDGVIYQPKELLGGKVFATFKVRDDLDILRGHFPGNPIVPGVVQIEMMAQASCFLVMKVISDLSEVKIEVALLAADRVKFRRPVRPGMSLNIESVCTRVRGSIWSYDCKITVENKLVSEASILASVKFIEN